MRKIFIPGETTYDIIFKNEKPVESRVGGSQLNTAVSLGRCKLPVQFISQISNDRVGKISTGFLVENGVDIEHVQRYEGNSRVALAYLDNQGDADYIFFKATGTPNLVFPNPKEDDIVLFGSSFATREDVRENLLSFLVSAKNNGAIIIYDPNFRPSGLSKLESLKPLIIENIKLSTIIKGSDEDFKHIFNSGSFDDTCNQLTSLGVHYLFYTAGKNKVEVLHDLNKFHFPVPPIKTLSTIGAGDNFNAGLIYSLYKQNILKNNLSQLHTPALINVAEMATRFAQQVCIQWDNYISADFARAIR